MSLRPIAKGRGRGTPASVRIVSAFDEDYAAWREKVVNAVRMIVYSLYEEGTFMDNEIADSFASPNARDICTEAFTAADVSEVNYERQEFFGDAISQALFAEYTYSKFQAGPDQLTNLKAHYTDNQVQGELLGDLAKMAGINEPLENLIRRNVTISHTVPIDMRNDLYESVFSAIYLVGNAHRNGLGYIWCKRLIEAVYHDKIDFEEYSQPSARSRLETMFTNFFYPERVRKPEVVSSKATVGEDGVSRVHTTVRINASIYQFLNSEFVTSKLTSRQKAFVAKMRKDQLIGEATEMLKKVSRRVAATNALKYIKENIGIDSEWARVNKERYDNIHINSNYEGLADKVIAKLVEMGYSNVDGEATYEVDKLAKFTIEGTRAISRLIGILPDGERVLLEVDAGDGNMFIAKVKLFSKFLANPASN